MIHNSLVKDGRALPLGMCSVLIGYSNDDFNKFDYDQTVQNQRFLIQNPFWVSCGSNIVLELTSNRSTVRAKGQAMQ